MPAGRLPTLLRYELVKRYPHDTGAFTQGLAYHDGVVYESTGLYGQSTLRAFKLETGDNLQHHSLDASYFAEGLTRFGDELIQLTWKSGQVFRYAANDFSNRSSQSIAGEGWGLASNGDLLISSDGSDKISFREPGSLQITQQITVSYAGRPLERVNELEWAHGCLYANIWMADSVALINPESGQTVYTMDLSLLARPERERNRDHVANGIAWRADNGNLLLTGKNWQWLYEVKVLPPDSN